MAELMDRWLYTFKVAPDQKKKKKGLGTNEGYLFFLNLLFFLLLTAESSELYDVKLTFSFIAHGSGTQNISQGLSI